MTLNMIFLLSRCVKIERMQENKKQREVNRAELRKQRERERYGEVLQYWLSLKF